ncbi:MAG: hypothetical protein ACLFTH_00385 [Candidatus Woesearchaeota archaeon]
MIAVVLFIVVIGIFYAYLSDDGKEDDDVKRLSAEAKVISNKLDCDVEDSNLCIVKNGEVIPSKVNTMKDTDYEELREELELDGDFCIYLRTPEGDLVPLNDTYGIGDDDFRLANGINCSQATS